MSHHPQFPMWRRTGTVLLALAAALAVGCSDGAGDADRRAVNIPCGPPGDSAIAVAVRAYLADVTPKPGRFLVPISGDTVLPEAGRQALQSTGPTYLFPPDPAQQRALMEKLATFGGWPTLLVTFHGARQIDETRASVRLGGRFVGGKEDGRVLPTKTVALFCEMARWTPARQAVQEERTT